MPSPYDDIIEREVQQWRREIEERSIHQSLFTNRHSPSDPASPPVVRIGTTQVLPSSFRPAVRDVEVEQPFPQGKVCCGDIGLLKTFTSVNLVWDFSSTCGNTEGCFNSTHQDRTWTVTDTYPPGPTEFIFICIDRGFGILRPEFSAGVHLPFGFDGYGPGLEYFDPIPLVQPWYEFNVDINTIGFDCDAFYITPYFTTSLPSSLTFQCSSPFDTVPGWPFRVPFVDLFSPLSYSLHRDCLHGSYDASWVITFT